MVYRELSACLEEDKVKRDAERLGQREAEKKRKEEEEKEKAKQKEAAWKLLHEAHSAASAPETADANSNKRRRMKGPPP